MLAFAPLHAKLLLASDERAESYRLVANELSDYRLVWAQRCAAKTSVHRLTSARFRLYAMSYGNEVFITPQLYSDFCLVHYALKEPIELTIDGQRVTIPEGGALFCNPARQVDLRWAAHCQQVILRVPTHALLPFLQGQPGRLLLSQKLPSYSVMTPLATQMWVTQLQAFAAYALNAVNNAHLVPWLSQIETSMAQYLMDGVIAPIQNRHLACAGSDQEVPHRSGASKLYIQARLERLQHFIDSRLDQPLTLQTLASEAAVSPRQLTAWVQQAWGLPPMAWVRRRRLHAMRQVLETQPHLDITGLALRYGFSHLGRFSAYYREEFSELPRDTRRRMGRGD